MLLAGLGLSVSMIIWPLLQHESEVGSTATQTIAESPAPIPAGAPTSTPGASRTPTRAPTSTSTQIPSPTVGQPTPTPTCNLGVDRQLASGWNRSRLGCPTQQAQTIWAAWQPFERGYMFWPSDTRRVIVFFGGRTWTEFPEQWVEGSPIPSRGDAPPGLVAPIRGFGYIWGTHDSVANGIGWAVDQEKGFCANIQRFEKGIIFHSSTVRFCQDELYNWATHPDFAPLFFSAYADETWQRW